MGSNGDTGDMELVSCPSRDRRGKSWNYKRERGENVQAEIGEEIV